ncbi:integrase arm-type DNA-binding domain-containing protein [Aurantiacibacter flavus]|uniref:Integrase arm-type DNA-binding domain-containing protein n=1 Tax=Aurantiacibacter flavus TaxID=3145232 RepID=A0ABV0CXJ0_9SPHN
MKVTSSGAASCVLQYRMGGRESKTRRYTIGGHGSPWAPAAARAEAERLSFLIAQGSDPYRSGKCRDPRRTTRHAPRHRRRAAH